jgi:beta-glucosidase
VVVGAYPPWLHGRFIEVLGDDFVRAGDLSTIHAGIDFLGVNYYTTIRVEATGAAAAGATDGGAPESGAPERDPVFRRPYPAYLEAVAAHRPEEGKTGKGWEVNPDGLREMLVWLHQEYGGLPLYITENGASYPDQREPDGQVHDPARADYLRAHFVAAHDAIGRGVDLRGYFVWSLLDNFEWADGYSERFGIIYVDFATLERTPKASARFLSDVARHNAVPPSQAGDL